MARHDLEGERPRGRRRGFPVWAMILVAFWSAALLAGAGALVLWGSKKELKREQEVAAANREPERDATGAYDPAELKQYFEGRSEAEALQFFGSPSQVVPVGQLTAWGFICPTRNPKTGKTGQIVSVICDRHKVARIECENYHP